MFRLLFLISIFSLLISCASINGKNQYIGIKAQTSGVKVYHENQFLGYTPMIASIDRKSKTYLTLEYNNSKKQIDLNAKYRWKEGILGNLVFLSAAPIALFYDYYYESAYEYPSELDLPIKATDAEINFHIKKIVIAPPKANSILLSEEIGDFLSQEIKKIYPQDSYQVVAFNDTLKKAYQLNIDNIEDVSNEQWLAFLGETAAQDIVISEVDIEGDQLHVKIKNYNHFKQEKIINEKWVYNSSKFKNLKANPWVFSESPFVWFPNSIGLDFMNNRIDIEDSKSTHTAEDSNYNDFMGQATRYISFLSLRYIEPPSKRDAWRYKFKMLPTAGLSINKYKFKYAPDLQDTEFDSKFAYIGYGPSFNYGNQFWNFYLNYYLIFYYSSLEATSQTKNITESETGGSAVFDLGLAHFINSSFSIRLFSRSISGGDDLLVNTIKKLNGDEYFESSHIQSGFSISYIIPYRFF